MLSQGLCSCGNEAVAGEGVMFSRVCGDEDQVS